MQSVKYSEIVVSVLSDMIQTIANDYDQELDELKLKYMIKRLYDIGNERMYSRDDYKKGFNELLVNYTTYRKISVASIMTAINKIKNA